LLPSHKTRSQENSSLPRVVVIGVGNLLMKDEGIGIHALEALQQIDLPADVELVDGGTSPDLIAYTKAGDRLILIDSAKAGGEPGAIYRFKPEDVSPETTHLTSAHELGVSQNLSLMSLLGNRPADTVIIGIEPGEIAPGLELSALLQQKLPEIVKVVLKEIQKP
jgi:hydrogenase maturation protease